MIGSFSSLLIAAAPPGAGMPSIDVPYQMMPAFFVYADCVSDRFSEDARAGGADLAAAAEANRAAVARCSDVREEQLRRSLELVTDYRPYRGSRRAAHEAVRRAFDTFDREFIVEPATDAPPPAATETEKN